MQDVQYLPLTVKRRAWLERLFVARGAEGLLKTLAYGITFGNRSLGAHQTQERLIFMPPDVAGLISAAGYSKQEVREFIHKHAYGSLGKFVQFMPVDDARLSPEWSWLQAKTEQARLGVTVPLLEGPDKIYIVVMGADRAKTLCQPLPVP